MSVSRGRLIFAVAFTIALATPLPAQESKPLPAAPPAVVDSHGDPLPAGARARLGTIRFRVADHVNCATLSPDGKILAAGNYQMITLLDAVTGKEVRRLNANFLGASSMTFAPDGKTLAAVGGNGRVNLWDVASGRSVAQLQPQGVQNRLLSVTFSGDGKIVAAGSENFNQQGAVHLWEAAGGKPLRQLEVLQNYRVLPALSADGKVLATWGSYINRGKGGFPNDNEAARTIQLWDVAAGKELRRVLVEKNQNVAYAALSPDGKTLAATSGGSTVYLWDVASGKELRRFAGRRGLGTHLAFAPDGKALAAGGHDGTVQMWEVPSGKRFGLCEGPPCRFIALGFTPGGARAWGVEGQTVCLWEVPSGRAVTPQTGHQNRIAAILFAAGGKELLTTSMDGRVLTWDAATGKQQRQLQLRDDDRGYGGNYYGGGNARFTSLVVSPDGKYLAGGSNYTGSIRLWDLATGKAVCDFEGGRSDAQAIAFSADSAAVAVAGMDRTARAWDVHTGQQLQQVKFKNADVRALAFTPDGKVLAAGATGWEPGVNQQMSEIRIVRMSDGKEIACIKRANTYLTALAFSPDGKVLASAWQNQAVELWDAATGREQRRLGGQVGTVQSLAFAPDGRTLAAGLFASPNAIVPVPGVGPAGANNPSVALWELATGQVRQRFAGHRGQVNCLAFSPEGRTLASGATDTTVLLWDLAGDAAPAQARTTLPARELEALWADLASPDAERGYLAIQKLRSSPAEAVPLLKKHLRPAKASGVTVEQIGKLVGDMNSNRFTVRAKAQKTLEELGDVASVPLRKAVLAPLASEEQRSRILKILEKLDKVTLSAEELRTARALEALEHIRDGEARQLLAALAEGAPLARLTRDARAVCRRLNGGAR